MSEGTIARRAEADIQHRQEGFMNKEEILQIFPENMRGSWEYAASEYTEKIQEIRLRAQKPAVIWIDGREYFLSRSGRLQKEPVSCICCSSAELEQILNQLCQYSLYAFSDEIRRGYLTIPGGHRVGLAGQTILDHGEQIRNMKYIRYLNVRIAHEKKGVSEKILPKLYRNGRVMNTLILSPPGCGKTTMLRDLIRNVSNGGAFGAGRNVSVVDERSEIGGSYMGIAQNDLGIRTDLLDACPKMEGMMLLIRSMAPEVLAVDELGSAEEIQALRLAGSCGCRILATIHGTSVEEIMQKKYMYAAIREGMFERIVVLTRREGCCMVEGVYDKDGCKC